MSVVDTDWEFQDAPRVVRWLVYALTPGLIVHELAHALVAHWHPNARVDEIDWSVPVVMMTLDEDATVFDLATINLAPVPLAVLGSLAVAVWPPSTLVGFVWVAFQLIAIGYVVEDVRLVLEVAAEAQPPEE